MRAAVEHRDREAILCGTMYAISRAIIPPMPRMHRRSALPIPRQRSSREDVLRPMTCRDLSSVHPTCGESRTSRMSLAISDVEYLISGLSDSPIPLLSMMRQE
jgi:hypothetical protein